jgi:phage tail-like protein
MPQTLEMHATFRYTINVDGVNHAVFSECKLPSLQIETLEVKEGGLNNYVHQLPVRLKAGSITLKHGITKGDGLLKWYVDTVRAMTTGNMASLLKSVTVTMLTIKREPMATFQLMQAYPKKWSGPTLKADDKAIAVEELELAFSEFTVE